MNNAYPPYPYRPSMGPAPTVHPPPGFSAGYPYPAHYPALPPAIPAPAAQGSFLTNPRFIKGALIGAAAAYLLTNETVQQTTIKTAVKAWSLLQGGVEEMKERFRDAEAELHAADAED